MTRMLRRSVLLPLAFLCGGCAIFGGGSPEHYGGSATLTEAAREAAKDSSDKHRRLDVGDPVPTYPGSSVSVGSEGLTDEDSGTPHESSGDSSPTPKVLGVVGGGGSLGGIEFEGFGFGGLDFGFFGSDHLRIDLAGMILSPNLSATSVAGQGLTDELELAADLSARYYLTPPHTFLGVYPLAGMRFGTLFWSYRNPILVTADGGPKTIQDDYLNYYGLYGGLGVSLVQTRHFTTGVHLTAGFRAYDENTFEGFHNNLFPTTGYTQIAFEALYKF
jgi:hypothetical protein